MPGDRTPEVSIARVTGRVDALEQRLGRQETLCEHRAAAHIDRELYQSERRSDRTVVDKLTERVAELERDLTLARREAADGLQQLRNEQSRSRRWLVGAVVMPAIATIVAVLLGVWA